MDILLDILLKPPQPLVGLFLMIPGTFEYFFRKWALSENFLYEGVIVTPLISLVLGRQVPRLHRGPIWFLIHYT